MKLIDFQITMYRSIINSGKVKVENLSVLVGKNESGKTSLLKALHKLNPATPTNIDINYEWPRGRRHERSDGQVFCTATFELSEEEETHIKSQLSVDLDKKTIKISKNYRNEIIIHTPQNSDININQKKKLQNLISILKSPIINTSEKYRTFMQSHINSIIDASENNDLNSIAHNINEMINNNLADTCLEEDSKPPHFERVKEVLQDLLTLATEIKENSSTLRKQLEIYLMERMPKFIYMDDYRTFHGKASLGDVQSRLAANKLTQEDRTFLMILSLSKLDLNKLIEQGNNGNHEERQYDISDAGETLTNIFKDKLKQNNYKIEYRLDSNDFLTMITDQRDKSLIKLEERSKGFQWFFSFDLLFMYESKGEFENCVILLDEPGLHLHPGAQSDLLKRLEEYARDNTLIYSTHLPFMIDLKHPERINIINEGDNGPEVSDDLTKTNPDSKLTLQSALGMNSSQSYLVSNQNIIVEGVDDYYILTALSELMWRSGEEGIPDEVLITPAGGASEVVYIATFMIGQKLRATVILDTDKAGKTAEEKLVKNWLTRYNEQKSTVLLMGEAVSSSEKEFAIEDMFTPDFYMKHVSKIYNLESDLTLDGGGMLCKQVERALKAKDIALNKGSVAKSIRRELNGIQNISELSEETQNYTRQLIKKIKESFL